MLRAVLRVALAVLLFQPQAPAYRPAWAVRVALKAKAPQAGHLATEAEGSR